MANGSTGHQIPRIFAVVPCFRCSGQIFDVLAAIPNFVERVLVVDDACPEQTGGQVETRCSDARVTVVKRTLNGGVGAATRTGFELALEQGADVVVKIDGDGQMDLAYLPALLQPILEGRADYTKGNRFFDLHHLRQMPLVRLIGNSLLSFVNKAVSGYWDVMDPTNGFVAIHRAALELLPLERMEDGYFFESDMLFRLYTIRAVVQDVPMPARYADESSNLPLGSTALRFPGKYLVRMAKRVFYNYFLRDFNAGTIQLLTGALLVAVGGAYGAGEWIAGHQAGVPVTSGNVMLAALPILVGMQLLVSAVNFDIGNVPKMPLQRLQPGAATAALRNEYPDR